MDRKGLRASLLFVFFLLLAQGAVGWSYPSSGSSSLGIFRQPRRCTTCRRASFSLGSDDKGDSASLIHAFAGLTQSSCKLLGVKSIGVDYGLVRTGIAKTAGYQPQAVEIVADLNETQVAQRVVRLAQLEGASKLIVGLPLHKNGTVAEQTNLTLAFGQVLAKESLRTLGPDVSVELWDERYTSKEAAARAHARNPHQTLYGMLDAEAACIILEQYYNDNGKDAQIIQVLDERARAECLQAYQQRQENERAEKQSNLDERERLLLRRKEAILRDQQSAAAATEGGGKKKKKKKRR